MRNFIIIIIMFCSLLMSCGKNANKISWSLGMGTLLGGGTYALTNDPQSTITATGLGLALGEHIGGKFDEVEILKQEVLNINRDNERSQFKKVNNDYNEEVIYEIQPNQSFKDYKNRQCRSYEYAYTKNGNTNHGKGYACLNGEGIWQELHHADR